jgi:hypothetical protein
VLAALRPASTIATVDAIPASRFISKSRTPRVITPSKLAFAMQTVKSWHCSKD